MDIKKVHQAKYQGGRNVLIAIAVFSLINLLLTVANVDMYFLFSASTPLILIVAGMYLTGKLPPEYYEGEFDSLDFFDGKLMAVVAIVAFVIVGMYFLAWWQSKTKRGWLTFGLVFFCIDTAIGLLYYGLELSYLIDLIFHIIAITWLSFAVYGAKKLKQLEKAEATVAPQSVEGENVVDLNNIDDNGNVAENAPATIDTTTRNSTPLRVASMDVKFRVLLQANVLGHDVVYRRVKSTNELVIDGNVYDEYTKKLEFDHVLSANIDGHIIAAGMAFQRSVIWLDNNVVEQKMRWY